jgi:hypothetical protein
MLDRKEILERAYHECMTEMYAKSQPSADYNQLLEDAKNGKIGKDERVYERYYLSHEEFKHILGKYKEAYNIKSHWIDDIEVLERYIKEGGSKDKYIEAHTDEKGNYHPGYRSYEKVKPIKEQLSDVLEEYGLYDENIHNKLYDTVTNVIDTCKNFYRFDREESSFDCSVALGPSPNSCAEAVIQYWAHQGVDIKIEERNPLLLWEMDYYGDDFEEVMKDEYGDNWKEYWDNKWKEEIKDKIKQ